MVGWESAHLELRELEQRAPAILEPLGQGGGRKELSGFKASDKEALASSPHHPGKEASAWGYLAGIQICVRAWLREGGRRSSTAAPSRVCHALAVHYVSGGTAASSSGKPVGKAVAVAYGWA